MATKQFRMAEPHIHKSHADKRKEMQAYIGSLERDLEEARRGQAKKKHVMIEREIIVTGGAHWLSPLSDTF